MGQPTTYGKWEEQRKQFVNDLLAIKEVKEKFSKEKIEQVLLNEVHNDMYLKAIEYAKSHSKDPIQNLTEGMYKESLTGILKTLVSTLEIEEILIKDAVIKFINEATDFIPIIIDDMVKIGKFSIETKRNALTFFYGEQFSALYPSLVPTLFLQDKDLTNKVMESIDNFVSKETFKNQKEVEEHLKYIHQIAPDITLSEEFQDLFRKTTGKSIEQYKDDHKNKKAFNSFQKYQQDTGKHSTPNFFPLTQAQPNEPIVPNDSYSPK